MVPLIFDGICCTTGSVIELTFDGICCMTGSVIELSFDGICCMTSSAVELLFAGVCCKTSDLVVEFAFSDKFLSRFRPFLLLFDLYLRFNLCDSEILLLNRKESGFLSSTRIDSSTSFILKL